MGHRLSKIYTRTGDDGQTGLGDGNRVYKSNLRIIALGEVDELNATIGVLRSHIQSENILSNEIKNNWNNKLHVIQHWLFDLGGELCIPNYQLLQTDSTQILEHHIDIMNQQLSPLKDFILPSGHLLCSLSHQTRTVCRRTERSLVSLHQEQPINTTALHFINRLSDWFFVAARLLQKQTGGQEVLWQKNINIEDVFQK